MHAPWVIRPPLRLLATLLSGVAYGLTFPPAGLHALAWVALVPLLAALDGLPWRRAAGLGLVWGTVAAYGVGYWFPGAISGYWGQPPWIGIAGFFGASAATGGAQYAAFAAVHGRLGRPRRATAPFAVAAGWVTAELVRASVAVRNPWGLAGLSQAAFLPAAQVAELTGVYGVSFCVVAVNAALAQAWLGRRDPDGAAVRRGLAGAAAAATLLVAYGAVRLATWPPPGRGAPVAVAQGAVPVSAQWSPERYGTNLDVYLGLTGDALRAARPRLVVWPESALTFFLEQEPAYRSTIARTLAAGPAELVVGGPRAAPGRDGDVHNAVFLLGADGGTRGVYDKEMLLPLAERFPLGTSALVRRSFGRVPRFAPGDPQPPLATAAGRAGVLVCNEAFFPDLARARVRDGAELLLVLANDSWVGDAQYARMAAAMATFRAIEQRRDVVRASTWGPSGVIDARGVMAAPSPLGARSVVAGTVVRRGGRTPYAVVGDLFALACALATVGRLAASRRR